MVFRIVFAITYYHRSYYNILNMTMSTDPHTHQDVYGIPPGHLSVVALRRIRLFPPFGAFILIWTKCFLVSLCIGTIHNIYVIRGFYRHINSVSFLIGWTFVGLYQYQLSIRRHHLPSLRDIINRHRQYLQVPSNRGSVSWLNIRHINCYFSIILWLWLSNIDILLLYKSLK